MTRSSAVVRPTLTAQYWYVRLRGSVCNSTAKVDTVVRQPGKTNGED